jgi:hypothetical protein
LIISPFVHQEQHGSPRLNPSLQSDTETWEMSSKSYYWKLLLKVIIESYYWKLLLKVTIESYYWKLLLKVIIESSQKKYIIVLDSALYEKIRNKNNTQK